MRPHRQCQHLVLPQLKSGYNYRPEVPARALAHIRGCLANPFGQSGQSVDFAPEGRIIPVHRGSCERSVSSQKGITTCFCGDARRTHWSEE